MAVDGQTTITLTRQTTKQMMMMMLWPSCDDDKKANDEKFISPALCDGQVEIRWPSSRSTKPTEWVPTSHTLTNPFFLRDSRSRGSASAQVGILQLITTTRASDSILSWLTQSHWLLGVAVTVVAVAPGIGRLYRASKTMDCGRTTISLSRYYVGPAPCRRTDCLVRSTTLTKAGHRLYQDGPQVFFSFCMECYPTVQSARFRRATRQNNNNNARTKKIKREKRRDGCRKIFGSLLLRRAGRKWWTGYSGFFRPSLRYRYLSEGERCGVRLRPVGPDDPTDNVGDDGPMACNPSRLILILIFLLLLISLSVRWQEVRSCSSYYFSSGRRIREQTRHHT